MMDKTKLLYLEDFSALTTAARVEEVTEENSKSVVVLDATIFYPQGGGQPYDTGLMESDAGRFTPPLLKSPVSLGMKKSQNLQDSFREVSDYRERAGFIVEETRFADGIVRHIGYFERGMFAPGESVKLSVDEARRTLHSRLHSAGHAVDMAVATLGLPWTPGKGFHFPQGPYVEYGGSLDGLDKEKIKMDLEALCKRFIGENLATKIIFPTSDEMKKIMARNPAAIIPGDKPGRVVMFGSFGVPCGGTHVSTTGAIGAITIRKIKAEGVNIRVGYDVFSC